jgi:hypothetical protein
MGTRAHMYEDNKYKARDRTTEDDHQWLKENYRKHGYKSAAGFLEEIINAYRKEKP